MDIGEVFLKLVPDSDGFREKAKAEVKAETAGLSATIPVRTDSNQVRKEGEKAAATFAKALTPKQGSSGGSGGIGGILAQFVPGGGGAAGAVPPLANPETIAGGIGAGLVALPFIAQAAAGGIVAALGGGLTAVAILGASKSKLVKASFADLSKSANYDLVQIGKPFRKTMSDILNTAETTLAELTPVFKGAATAIAGPFKKFGDTLVSSFAQPAVAKSITAVAGAFGQILTAITPQLPGMVAGIAGAITDIAKAVSKNPKAFADFIKFLVDIGIWSLKAIAWLANFADWVESHWGTIGPILEAPFKIFIDWTKANIAILVGIVKVGLDVIQGHWGKAWTDIKNAAGKVWTQIKAGAEAFWKGLLAAAGTWLDKMRHNIASIFDGIRHDIATAWDTVWRNTVTRTQNGIADVIHWVAGLPGRALAALSGLGHSLAAFMRAAFSEMWTAAKNVAGSIWNWLTGWVKALPGWLRSLLGIKSPSSVFYNIGKNMMLGLEHGIKDHANAAKNAALRSVSFGLLGGGGGLSGGSIPGQTGALSGNAQVAQSFAASILPRGWSMIDLIRLWNQESGWNSYAVNPSSGAYGIPQSLGHGHPYNLGDYKAQIVWGLNYIAGRYGSSQAAWAHEQAFDWYDQGGWLQPGVTMAVNNTGRPERVSAPGEIDALIDAVERMHAGLASLLEWVPQATGAHTGAALGNTLNGLGTSAVRRRAYPGGRPGGRFPG